MKSKKKFIALLTVFVMSLQMLCPVFAANADRVAYAPTEKTVSREVDAKGSYENLEYVIADGEVTITGYVTAPEGALVIPETIEGYPVTTIGEYAFFDCSSLTSVEMPSVQTVGYAAFCRCVYLTSAEMPSVQTIGNQAFEFCHSMTSVEMPNAQTIGYGAFRSCESLTNVEMTNVQTISEVAFSWCTSLTSVEMRNVQTIDRYAFLLCSSLTSAYFYSDAPTSFREGVFDNCASDFAIYYANGTQGWTTPEWNGYPAYPFDVTHLYGNLKYVIIGDEVTITGYVLPPEGELVIPETIEGLPVTAIGDRAFDYCTAITSVSMPSVETVGEYAFAQEWGGGKESSITKLKSVNMPKVQSIGEYAFEDCVSLTTVEMPQAMSIGFGAFYFCESLTSVEMPNVQTIGERAFSGCYSLTSVEMPNVQSIDIYAFLGCDSLTSVEMENVQTVSGGAFIGCSSLTAFIIGVDNKNYSAEGGILYNKDKSTLIAYPSAADDIEIADSVQTIGDWSLAYCTSLTSIEMPKVQTIGDYALAICTSLTSVEMPNVLTMGKEAFSSCYSLTSVEMPKVQTIGDCAFLCCESLTSAYFYSDAPTSFGEDVFAGCYIDFAIYYVNGTQGWTTPEWNGYPAYPICDVTGVTLDKTEAELEIGSTVQLTATVTPDDATNRNVTWTSSDDSIATVDEKGLVTAISTGTVTITVTTEDGEFTATCEVTVVDSTVSVTGITLDKTEAELEIGGTVQLTATVTPENATNKNVTWTSSDDSIATVDKNGLVTAISEGTVTITVTTEDGGYTATCEVTVNSNQSLGDLNGDGKINTADAVSLLKLAAGMIELTPEQEAVADVNRDGTVNTADAVTILKYAAGLIDEL